jgi:hypothetical protein
MERSAAEMSEESKRSLSPPPRTPAPDINTPLLGASSINSSIPAHPPQVDVPSATAPLRRSANSNPPRNRAMDSAQANRKSKKASASKTSQEHEENKEKLRLRVMKKLVQQQVQSHLANLQPAEQQVQEPPWIWDIRDIAYEEVDEHGQLVEWFWGWWDWKRLCKATRMLDLIGKDNPGSVAYVYYVNIDRPMSELFAEAVVNKDMEDRDLIIEYNRRRIRGELEIRISILKAIFFGILSGVNAGFMALFVWLWHRYF